MCPRTGTSNINGQCPATAAASRPTLLKCSTTSSTEVQTWEAKDRLPRKTSSRTMPILAASEGIGSASGATTASGSCPCSRSNSMSTNDLLEFVNGHDVDDLCSADDSDVGDLKQFVVAHDDGDNGDVMLFAFSEDGKSGSDAGGSSTDDTVELKDLFFIDLGDSGPALRI